MKKENEAELIDESVGMVPATVADMTPAKVFVPEMVTTILDAVRHKALSAPVDLTTAKGRKLVASTAHDVARSKTLLDNMGKELISDWKVKTDAVNVERKKLRDGLDTLKAEVRAPLTKWEEDEEKRIEAERVAEQISKAHDRALEENDLIDREAKVKAHEEQVAKDEAERVAREEAEAEEKAQIARDEEIKKEAKKEAEAKAKKAKADSAKKLKDAKQAEKLAKLEKKQAEEKAKKEKVEAAKKAKKDKADAVRKTKADAEKKAKKVEEERVAKANAEQEEKDAKDAERVALEKRLEKNKKHRARIDGEVKKALMSFGVSGPRATQIIDNINKGFIPHTKINYI